MDAWVALALLHCKLSFCLSKVGTQIFYFVGKSKIRKKVGLFGISNPHIYHKGQSTNRKADFLLNPQVANSHISEVCQSANRRFL
jgi:hypothetical protein